MKRCQRMNTRSKSKELVNCGELCAKCLDKIIPWAYATWCQTNVNICLKCLGHQCQSCRCRVDVEQKIYVLDGIADCMLLCKECYIEEIN